MHRAGLHGGMRGHPRLDLRDAARSAAVAPIESWWADVDHDVVVHMSVSSSLIRHGRSPQGLTGSDFSLTCYASLLRQRTARPNRLHLETVMFR